MIFCKIKAFHGAGCEIRTRDLMITKICRHGLSAALASVRRCSLGFALLFEPVRSVVSTGFFPLMGQRMGQKNRPRRTARRRRFSFLCREYNSCVRRCQIIFRVRKRRTGSGRALRAPGEETVGEVLFPPFLSRHRQTSRLHYPAVFGIIAP